MTLTADRLRSVLSYDPRSGLFTWIARLAHRIRVGDTAGSFDANGYVLIGIDGVIYKAHRLAFLYQIGCFPTEHVDHINGDVADNSWWNLREVCEQTNQQNKRRARKDSSTGLLGVVPKRGRFAAYIGVSGKNFYLGTYDTPEQAHERYISEKRARHAGCTL